MRSILIVEDDHFHRQVIEKRLTEHLGEGTTFRAIRNEKEFVRSFDEIKTAGYDLALVDQMLPWTHEDDEEIDDDAPPAGPLRAGLRCAERLAKDPLTSSMPVIFFTNLERKTVPENAPYVRKKDDEHLDQLMQEIDRLLPRT